MLTSSIIYNDGYLMSYKEWPIQKYTKKKAPVWTVGYNWEITYLAKAEEKLIFMIQDVY